ncbi:MAG TPA: hypothetical protein VE972_08140 [Conexibacter sp.]|nr:hypothetical protein [Conexibacter sp.]
MPLDFEKERAAAARAEGVRVRVGHPGERWGTLCKRIETERIRDFADVTTEFLALMWCLDQYRIADAPPERMGRLTASYSSRMDGVYRGKGNWFATLLALLLGNRTGQTIRSLSRIKGFSQVHQIDLAWPDRNIAPIVCAESKVTGGPAYRGFPARGAMDDWTNRRKELKFSATDLKLSRREQTQKIGHWGVWRARAAPRTFILWGARLRPDDRIERMVKETEALLATYLDGAGLFAWRESDAGDAYVPVPLPDGATVETIDVALWRIESEIGEAIESGALAEQVETAAPVDPVELEPDADE